MVISHIYKKTVHQWQARCCMSYNLHLSRGPLWSLGPWEMISLYKTKWDTSQSHTMQYIIVLPV